MTKARIIVLGFKRRFEPMVRDGSKQHTIRAFRKIAPRVGDMCHCYVDSRQRTMTLIGRWPCVKVQEIIIAGTGCPDSTYVEIDGELLVKDERDALAWADGFRSNEPFDEMMSFWRAEHGNKGKPLYFHGQIIHWQYKKEAA